MPEVADDHVIQEFSPVRCNDLMAAPNTRIPDMNIERRFFIVVSRLLLILECRGFTSRSRGNATASGTTNHVGLSELYRIAGHERRFVDLVLRPANGSLITVKRGFTGSVRKLTTDGFVANVTVNHLDNSKICTSGRASQGQWQALYATQRPRYRVAIKSQLVLNVASKFLHIRNRVVEKAVNAVLDEIVTAMARKIALN